jgi:hypothetical protein
MKVDGDRETAQQAFTKRLPHQPKPETKASKMKEEKMKNVAVVHDSRDQVRPACVKHFAPHEKHYPLAHVGFFFLLYIDLRPDYIMFQ